MAGHERGGHHRAAQLLMLVIGLVYLVLAVGGFAVTGTNEFERVDPTFLGFGVSTLHNVLHALIGALALLSTRKLTGATVFGWLGFMGLIGMSAYGVVVMLGDSSADPLNVNWPVNVLHLVTAVALLLIGYLANREREEVLHERETVAGRGSAAEPA
jgi:uncharacterized protein DUF4383